MAPDTQALLAQLETLDGEEDRIIRDLVRRGAQLEDKKRRENVVSVADLRTLRDEMNTLEAAIDRLQASVARAEDASAPLAPAPAPGNGASATGGAPAPAPGASPAPGVPPTPPAPSSLTFVQLEALIADQDAQAERLRATLRERLLELDPPANGHAPAPGTAAPRTFKLRPVPLTGRDIEVFQHDLNRWYRSRGSKLRVAEDGVYGSKTRLAARRALGHLGVDAEDLAGGVTPDMRRLVRKAIAAAPRPAPGHAPKPRPGPAGSRPAAAAAHPAAPPPGSIQAAIRKHGGRYEDVIVREAKRNKLPVSLVCAVLQKESEFRNVYGRDSGARPNPIRSPKGGLLQVTEANYKTYLAHCRAGKDRNGVGPMQLTFGGYQQRADKLGGCWKVGPNIRVGCEALAENIKRLGTREGIRAYNGTGDDARRYASSVLQMQAAWQQILKGKPVAPPSVGSSGKTVKPGHPAKPAGPPRTFTVTKGMNGDDVKAWQETLSRQFASWKVDYPLATDGNYGPVTRSATRDALKGLGIAQETMAHGVTPELRVKVRHKHLTAGERARHAARAPWRKALSKKFASKGVAPPLNKILTSANGFTRGGHDGVDLICGPNVPIMALCDAEVIDVRSGGWWGKSPSGDVTKGDGIIQLKCLTDAGPFQRGMHFGYGHAEHATVRKGDRVKAGEVIGKAGFAVAWHVHFMANGGGTMQGRGDRDPMPYVNYAIKHGR